MYLKIFIKVNVLLFLFFHLVFTIIGCKPHILPEDSAGIIEHSANEEPDWGVTIEQKERIQEDISQVFVPSRGNTDFFKYLGMSFIDIETRFGIGEEETEFQHENGYIVYKFSDSNYRFIFQFDYETDSIEAEATCCVIAVPLHKIILTGDEIRIQKDELEQYFCIKNWPVTASWPDPIGIDDGHDAPWSNVYTIWGEYNGNHFNVYLDANEENKTSIPINAYFYFYLPVSAIQSN
jgi:hypothetical protein